MSRIAYIISAYKDAPHLARLVAALDDRADFYVHIDLNASERRSQSEDLPFIKGCFYSGGRETVRNDKIIHFKNISCK